MRQAGAAGTPPTKATHGLATLLVIAMTVFSAVFLPMSGVVAQELPTQPASPPPAEPTPAAQVATGPSEFAAGAPHVATIAQGLVSIDGPLVWRVREVQLSATGAPETANSSFVLQRTGAAIVRNELTTRRTRLEIGEAQYMAGGDPFLRYAVGSDPSIVWLIELLTPEAAATGVPANETVLFNGDAINDYPKGTFDAELQRGILLPNEVSDLPPHTGPALVVVTSGRLEASADGGQPASLGAGTVRLVAGQLTLRNADSQPAGFVVAALGEPVDGAEQPAAAQAAPTQPPAQAVPTVLLPPVDQAAAAQPTAVPAVVEPTPVPAPQDAAPSEGDTDGDGWSDAEEIAYGSDPLNRDYDADGILDGEEIYVYGTDPLNNDSDGDGLLDGDEVFQNGTSPAAFDSDGDGLGDADEIFVYGTAPGLWDTDGDGISDGDEVFNFGTNPLDPASGP